MLLWIFSRGDTSSSSLELPVYEAVDSKSYFSEIQAIKILLVYTECTASTTMMLHHMMLNRNWHLNFRLNIMSIV